LKLIDHRIYLGLLSIFLVIPLQGQPGNARLYQQLWQRELDSRDLQFNQVKGENAFFPEISTDSSFSWSLTLFPPSISYQKLRPGLFLRSFSQNYQLEGEGIRSGRLLYADSLSKKDMKQLIRISPQGLKGESPTLANRYLRPGAWILVSTGTILGLFYIRSR